MPKCPRFLYHVPAVFNSLPMSHPEAMDDRSNATTRLANHHLSSCNLVTSISTSNILEPDTFIRCIRIIPSGSRWISKHFMFSGPRSVWIIADHGHAFTEACKLSYSPPERTLANTECTTIEFQTSF